MKLIIHTFIVTAASSFRSGRWLGTEIAEAVAGRDAALSEAMV